MAATAAPYGARPIGTLSASGSFTAKFRHFPIATTYGTDMFHGDFVQLVAGGGVELDTGTATLTPVGIFMGCFYTDPTTNQPTYSQYWPASNAATDAVAYVLDDPYVVFQIQADGIVAAADRGQNAGVVQTAGNTAIGKSKNALDQSTLNTTNTLPLKVIDFVDGPDSTVGDAFTDCICIFNTGHEWRNSTGV